MPLVPILCIPAVLGEPMFSGHATQAARRLLIGDAVTLLLWVVGDVARYLHSLVEHFLSRPW